MNITTQQLQTIITGKEEIRVESLRKLLEYPIKERDPKGSRFWYLRPGSDENEAAETCPVAVGFYDELADITDSEARKFLTAPEQQQEIYGHYTSRIFEQQPVMYLLLPSEGANGRVPLILPGEGGLRQRQIETFDWHDNQLLARLKRLTQGELPIAARGLMSVPLVEWVFYEPIKTAKELALKLAQAARHIEQVIPTVYNQEQEDGYLHTLLKSFQRELLPSLKLSSDNEKDYSFADIYAQTIAYALFTARVFGHVRDKRAGRTKETLFDRESAWQQLPETNPFLRKLFKDVSKRSAEELGDELIGAIADIFVILRATKMDAILSDFEMKMNREDIVIRFYEDFLAAYKPQMRERRGVYYTPEPVVSYMVRSVDILVKEKFNKPLGLADPEVMILDPACGTGTFLLWICKLIYQRFQESPAALTEGLDDKSWSGYVKERLLPRIFGFELLMSPYAIAHLKIGLFLEETGYQVDSGKRLGIYLINTLEDITLRDETQQLNLAIPQMEELIAEEARAGSRIKKQEPIMVVIGNPPYSGHSENNNPWIKELVNDYKYCDGQKLDIRQPKWLQNDYIKFIRFAEWRIEKSGKGILSYITDHSYLDGETFIGLRNHLIHTFEAGHIINLHGNINKQEKSPDGSKDENIFDISQGTAINFFIKLSNKKLNSSDIFYCDIYGVRESAKSASETYFTGKYDWLNINSIKTTDFITLQSQKPLYLFRKFLDYNLTSEYNNFFSLDSIFSPYGKPAPGIVTTHDQFAISWNEQECIDKVNNLLATKSEEDARKLYKLCSQDQWSYPKAKKELKSLSLETLITPIYYRPFDIRFTIYNNNVAVHLRERLTKHLFKKHNIALIISKLTKGESFKHIQITSVIPETICMSPKTSNNGFVFPLYLYPDTNKPQELQQQKRPNFSEDFLKKIEINLGYIPIPETIFYYIYAIFHSPTYRSRYAEFLKIDFPRVPLTSNNELFCQLAEYGEELVALHLMKSPKLNNLITQFTENGGSQIVDAGHPKYTNGAVVINKKGDKFVGVPEDVWNFYIGGYQVCQKWLKDRKNRPLSDEDILHYQKIIVVLQETIKLMQQIDETIPQWPFQ